MEQNELITLKSILAEMIMKIPEEDRVSVSNLEVFLTAVCDGYVGRLIPQRWKEHKVVGLNVDNRRVSLPPDFDKVVQMVGSTKKKKRMKGLRKEIVGWMKKATDGCTYTVFKNCDKCGKDDCDHPVVLASRHLDHELAKGTEYWLKRHVWGFSEDEKGNKCSPYSQDFFLMRPNLASFFNVKDTHISQCLNLKFHNVIGTKYEYEIFNKKIKTNFDEGVIVLSYLAKCKADDGSYMLPQLESFVTAVISYGLKEFYLHLSRIFKTRTYRDLYREHKQIWAEDHVEAERDLYHIPYDQLVMALGSVRMSGHIDKSFLSSTSFNYPDWLKIYDENTRAISRL